MVTVRGSRDRVEDGMARDKNKRALTREAVLAAALQITDESGLDALTMRNVAHALGVYPNAVYWHVGSRSELLSATSALLFADIVLPDAREHEWTEWISLVARMWRDAMHRHPRLGVVAGTQLITSTAGLPIAERILAVLVDAGFEGEHLVDTYNAVVGFMIGWPTVELSTQPVYTDAESQQALRTDMTHVDPRLFPTVAHALPDLLNNAFFLRWEGGGTHPLEQAFETALELLITGLRQSQPSNTK